MADSAPITVVAEELAAAATLTQNQAAASETTTIDDQATQTELPQEPVVEAPAPVQEKCPELPVPVLGQPVPGHPGVRYTDDSGRSPLSSISSSDHGFQAQQNLLVAREIEGGVTQNIDSSNHSESSSHAQYIEQPIVGAVDNCQTAVQTDCNKLPVYHDESQVPAGCNEVCTAMYDYHTVPVVKWRMEEYKENQTAYKTVLVDKTVPDWKCVTKTKQVPCTVRKMVKECVPCTVPKLMPHQVECFKYETVKKEVPCTKTVTYTKEVPSTKTVCQQVKVPCKKTIMKQVAVDSTKKVQKMVTVDSTKEVREVIKVPCTKTVKVPTTVPYTKTVTKYKPVKYQKEYEARVYAPKNLCLPAAVELGVKKTDNHCGPVTNCGPVTHCEPVVDHCAPVKRDGFRAFLGMKSGKCTQV